jgi:hypothetical protein
MKFGYEEQLQILLDYASRVIYNAFLDRYKTVDRKRVVEVGVIEDNLLVMGVVDGFYSPKSYLSTISCVESYIRTKGVGDPRVNEGLLKGICELENIMMMDPMRKGPAESDYMAVMELIKQNHYYATSDMISFIGLTYDLCYREEDSKRSKFIEAISMIGEPLSKNISALTEVIKANKGKIVRGRVNFADYLLKIIDSCNNKAIEQYQDETVRAIDEYVKEKRRK